MRRICPFTDKETEALGRQGFAQVHTARQCCGRVCPMSLTLEVSVVWPSEEDGSAGFEGRAARAARAPRATPFRNNLEGGLILFPTSLRQEALPTGHFRHLSETKHLIPSSPH